MAARTRAAQSNPYREGDLIKAGTGDHYDEGAVVEVSRDHVTVGWDSGVQTTHDVTELQDLERAAKSALVRAEVYEHHNEGWPEEGAILEDANGYPYRLVESHGYILTAQPGSPPYVGGWAMRCGHGTEATHGARIKIEED